MQKIKQGISKFFISLLIFAYFRKVIFLDLSKNDPLGQMAVLSHRNGAIDGFLYAFIFPQIQFLLAKNLRRSFLGKIFFHGIEITRKKDREKALKQGLKIKENDNFSTLKQCLNLMQNGNTLGIFPEGTSALNPKHLKFDNGASKIAHLMLKKDTLEMTPLSIFYDDPAKMGSKVFIVKGKNLKWDCIQDKENLHTQISTALESILIEFKDEKEQEICQNLAVFASLYRDDLYLKILKNSKILELQEKLKSYENKSHKAFLYKNCAIFPKSFWLSLWVFLITVIIVAPTFLLNLPTLIGSFIAAKFSKEKHTISLYKILSGVSIFTIFYVILALFSPFLAFLCMGLSLWGFHLYGAFKKHGISLLNAIFFKRLKQDYDDLQEKINECFKE
ncbi:1-acyl-sn-glycerol-3-phosphate acyltransferase [Campylobacter sp. B0100352/1]|uniref:1-acyl-sn-glycerol-3-phosphate acyltransferase n=1 Tax=unclassified Campylobacter TaxID=2593542 RepID=UPI001D2E8952|nr:1-acyl-sn-glycerol-3-phosphate acyltransferase [Campylobacter sp. B0100352/1]MBZ7964564.1 1-acyl-sn-glycerol-3-phosphate acyltransferase [Campylobacter sp. 2457A]